MNNKKGTLLRRQFYGEENDTCKSKLVRASIIEDKTLKTLFAPRQPYPVLGEFYYAPGEFFHSSDFFNLLERFRDNEEDQGRLSDGGIHRTISDVQPTQHEYGIAFYLAGAWTTFTENIDPPEIFFHGIDDTNSLYLGLKDPSNEKWPKKSKLVKIEKVAHIYYNVNYTHGAIGGICAYRWIKEEFYTKLIEDAIDIEAQLQEHGVYTNYHLNQNTVANGDSGIYFDIVPTVLNNFFPNFGPFINPVQLVIVDMKGGYGRRQDVSAGNLTNILNDPELCSEHAKGIAVNGPINAQKNAENYAQNRESLVSNLLEKFDKFKLIVTKDSSKGVINSRIEWFENYYIPTLNPSEPGMGATGYCRYENFTNELGCVFLGQVYTVSKAIEGVKMREIAFKEYFQTYCSAMGYDYLDGNSGVVNNIKDFFGIS